MINLALEVTNLNLIFFYQQAKKNVGVGLLSKKLMLVAIRKGISKEKEFAMYLNMALRRSCAY